MSRPGERAWARSRRRLRRASSRRLACLLAIGLGVSVSAIADGLEMDSSISLGSWSPYATQYVVRRPVCAWSAGPERFYRVIADALESPGEFHLIGDLDDTIRYVVRWRKANGGMGRLYEGLPSNARHRFETAPGCPDGGTEIEIQLSKADADRAPGGFYSSTLTITLVAE